MLKRTFLKTKIIIIVTIIITFGLIYFQYFAPNWIRESYKRTMKCTGTILMIEECKK
jgi:hypothetical protein